MGIKNCKKSMKFKDSSTGFIASDFDELVGEWKLVQTIRQKD